VSESTSPYRGTPAPAAVGMISRPSPSRGGGWLWFSASVLILVGACNLIVGLAAVLRSPVYVNAPSGGLVLSLAAWGWIHLLAGAVLVLAGCGLFANSTAARVFAAVIVGLNAITHVAFLPAYPIWSLLIILLDVVILWSVLTHGE